jgi:beta-glucosidase
MRSVPSTFLWGAATSSYQVEGAVAEDGRGPSIWDDLCRRAGAIANGDTGDVACDHFHGWEHDLDIAKSIGLNAYRFSIAWPRVIPDGDGAVNERGLDFYSRLVDGCLERGIEPCVTLYHWDLPSALEAKGGWRVRATAEAFERYVEVVARRLGDRVTLWGTINEPFCVVDLGHRQGAHAPGARESDEIASRVLHHVMLGHGMGVRALRSALGDRAKIGWAHLTGVPEPLTDRGEHLTAAREGFAKANALYLDPVMKGSYPTDEWFVAGGEGATIEPGDMEIISQPVDWVGLNIYSCWSIARGGVGTRAPEAHYPRTDMGWPIMPDCLHWGPRLFQDLYGEHPIFITEAGCAYPDAPNEYGEVEDYARVSYLRGHLRALQRAVAEGIPVRGIFIWSLLDNFEWAQGYAKRFGLVHVDFQTLRRTPKVSALWLREVIEDGGV